jgi:hypothetical protein
MLFEGLLLITKRVPIFSGTNLKNLDSNLARKSEALQECNNEKIRADEKAKKTEQDNAHKEELISRLKDEIVSWPS